MIIEYKNSLNDKAYSCDQALIEAEYYVNILRKYKNDIRLIYWLYFRMIYN